MHTIDAAEQASERRGEERRWVGSGRVGSDQIESGRIGTKRNVT